MNTSKNSIKILVLARGYNLRNGIDLSSIMIEEVLFKVKICLMKSLLVQ